LKCCDRTEADDEGLLIVLRVLVRSPDRRSPTELCATRAEEACENYCGSKRSPGSVAVNLATAAPSRSRADVFTAIDYPGIERSVGSAKAYSRPAVGSVAGALVSRLERNSPDPARLIASLVDEAAE
jgi:hypothetical protein